MINIISKSYQGRLITGPKKVVDNLIKGLDLISYPYVVNRRLDACQRLWIHDDLEALKQSKNLPSEIKVVAGPNLVVLPRHLPPDLDLSRIIYLHPSKWAVDFWEDFGFHNSKLVAWPVGIDTKDYAPSDGPKSYVLVYFKQRTQAELEQVLKSLRSRGLNYKIVRYGSYTEAVYKKLLGGASFVFWLGRHESQGIALEEALAAGAPMLVWDVASVGQWVPRANEADLYTPQENAYANTTSAPYFDSSCGIIFKDPKDLDGSIAKMQTNLASFKPREFILNNLSLEKQARDFVELYHKFFGLSFEAGLSEQVLRAGEWQKPGLYSQTKSNLKSAIKAVNRRLRL